MSFWNRVKFVWMNGKMVDKKNATVHISSPVVQMAHGVFDGIRAYWDAQTSQLYVFRLKDHVNRLLNSTRIFRMQVPFSKEDVENAVVKLLISNDFREDVYIRTIVYSGGLWHDQESIDLSIFAAPRPSRLKNADSGIKCCVSSWRRISDSVMPPRVKACCNYGQFRLAGMEAKSLGYDNTILLTSNGKVSETPVSNVFIVRDGSLITPTITSDILEGITRDTVIKIASEDLRVGVSEREVDRTELYIAEEVFICGTGGAEITPVISVDNIQVSDGKPGEITEKLRSLYFKVVTRKVSKYSNWLTPVCNE